MKLVRNDQKLSICIMHAYLPNLPPINLFNLFSSQTVFNWVKISTPIRLWGIKKKLISVLRTNNIGLKENTRIKIKMHAYMMHEGARCMESSYSV